MNRIEQATEIIKEQRKLPQELKEKLNSNTFYNLIISIALMIYILAINIVYLNEPIDIFEICMKIFAMLLISIDIAIFEIGYRKDNISLWIHALELLTISIFILCLKYVYMFGSSEMKTICMLSPIYCSIYYVGKMIIIHVVETKKYQNNLSDVREIIKEDNESYLDDIKSEDIVESVNSIEEMKKMEKDAIKKAKKVKKQEEENK